MPTYEYSCRACGGEFEREQRITEPPISTCLHCGKDAAARRIAGATFQLKGGGWYADGYVSNHATPNSSSGEAAP